MANASLSEHMKQQRPGAAEEDEHVGPFVTISRQYGCYGFSLGLLLMEILNENADAELTWRIYHKEILARLATETDTAEGLLQRERRAKPGVLTDLFRSLSKGRIPSGQEIRRRITMIIRGLATTGHAIIIGQGGAGATRGLANGLSVRLEAPEDWRTREVALRDGLPDTEAKVRLRAKEDERAHLRKLYESRVKGGTAFNLVYDCSVFTLAQIAQQVVYAMKLKGCL